MTMTKVREQSTAVKRPILWVSHEDFDAESEANHRAARDSGFVSVAVLAQACVSGLRQADRAARPDPMLWIVCEPARARRSHVQRRSRVLARLARKVVWAARRRAMTP